MVSILSQYIHNLVIISVDTYIEMCIKICYYLREDLPSSLFIQKLAIFEVEDQPRFYALDCDKGQILLQTQRNMEFIVMKRNVATVNQESSSDIFGISLCLSRLGWNILREQCTPSKDNKDAFLTEHSRCLMIISR